MKNYSILLVDDEDIVLTTVGNDLRNEGYDVSTASSGEEGIRKLKENHIDLIITDLLMEGLDGMAVLKEAKKISPEIIVLILTGYKSLSSAVDAMRLGASDYMLKPCDRDELFKRVANCLETLNLKQQMEKNTAELEFANEQLKQEVIERRRIEEELRESRKQLIEINKDLQRLSNLDGLTGIPNRRFFDEFLDKEWKRALRQKAPMSLIMIDIDFFKMYNDNYGHQAGDDCLIKVASVINETLNRPGDLMARYGGEEFVVVLGGTKQNGALLLAKTLCANVEGQKITHGHSSVCSHVTISLGVASIVPNRTTSHKELIAAADKALYKAKNGGRNQVKVC